MHDKIENYSEILYLKQKQTIYCMYINIIEMYQTVLLKLGYTER